MAALWVIVLINGEKIRVAGTFGSEAKALAWCGKALASEAGEVIVRPVERV
jgi:hypothetical protein